MSKICTQSILNYRTALNIKMQTPPRIQIPELSVAELRDILDTIDTTARRVDGILNPPPLHRLRISDELEMLQPTNLMNEFDQVANLASASPIPMDHTSVFNDLRNAYRAFVEAGDTYHGYTDEHRDAMYVRSREIMNSPLGVQTFVLPKQDDYEIAFTALEQIILCGSNQDTMGDLLDKRAEFYRAFCVFLDWLRVDDTALTPFAYTQGYVMEYVSFIV